MKYIILKIITCAVMGSWFIGTTWWCLFVSEFSPEKLWAWWIMVLFVSVNGGVFILMFISDKERGL